MNSVKYGKSEVPVRIKDKYYEDSAPAISIVKMWFTVFRSDGTSRSDAENFGRPIDVATSETIE